MQNEVRYYLEMIKAAMQPLSDTERADALLNSARETEEQKPVRKVFVPTHIITVVQLPSGSKEIAINTADIAGKIDYILEAYDSEMRLKTNEAVSMLNLLVV